MADCVVTSTNKADESVLLTPTCHAYRYLPPTLSRLLTPVKAFTHLIEKAINLYVRIVQPYWNAFNNLGGRVIGQYLFFWCRLLPTDKLMLTAIGLVLASQSVLAYPLASSHSEPASSPVDAIERSAKTITSEKFTAAGSAHTQFDSWQQQIDHELLTEWRRLSGMPHDSHQLRWPTSQFQPTQHCQQAVIWHSHQTIQPGRLQLQVRCDQPFWQLNTSLILDQERRVAVAQRDISRGERIDRASIRFISMNVAELPRGYISDDCQCDTWQSKRTIKQGRVLTPGMLEPVTLIERGQTIMIHSQQPGMTIAMAGIAMSDGHLQQRIRVRNTSSDRIIWARVIAADKVLVP